MKLPNNFGVFDPKPQILSIDRTTAVFKVSSVTYNSSTTTYSSSTTFYGGSDRVVDKKPQTGNILNI